MVKIGDAVIYKGHRATDYVGKKAKVLEVGEVCATLKFVDGHIYDCARITNLKKVAKVAPKKAVKKVAKKVTKKVVAKKSK